jgi:hypothetical protein
VNKQLDIFYNFNFSVPVNPLKIVPHFLQKHQQQKKAGTYKSPSSLFSAVSILKIGVTLATIISLQQLRQLLPTLS